VLAMALGGALGALLGGAQWTILRRHTARAGAWIWANAVAWSVGMPCVFVGMDLVPWSGSPALVVLSIYAVGLFTGLLVGSIQGCVLVSLMADSNRVGRLQETGRIEVGRVIWACARTELGGASSRTTSTEATAIGPCWCRFRSPRRTAIAAGKE
jgi:hypothetical protein